MVSVILHFEKKCFEKLKLHNGFKIFNRNICIYQAIGWYFRKHFPNLFYLAIFRRFQYPLNLLNYA